MAYKGKYTVKKLGKYLGNPKNVTFRSLWELSVMKFIEDNDDIVKWSSEVEIKYMNQLDQKIHRYYIDFYIQYKDGSVALVEVKPKKQCSAPSVPKRKTKRYINECATWITNCSKWEAAKKICAQNGYSFEIWDEYVIKSKGIKIISGK